MEAKKYICPVCKGKDLYLKHEASYVYSYVLDSDAPGMKNKEIFSLFLYDRREQTESLEYVECDKCKTRFQSDLLFGSLDKSDFTLYD
ncbi:MAG: hypothetical protein GX271_01955 [Clostridiales bacterium]|nr:hypothetical protein [Clostridiales bacterium]